MGRCSRGMSPGDLGRATWGRVSLGDRVRAFRSSGGGIGLILLGRVASPLLLLAWDPVTTKNMKLKLRMIWLKLQKEHKSLLVSYCTYMYKIIKIKYLFQVLAKPYLDVTTDKRTCLKFNVAALLVNMIGRTRTAWAAGLRAVGPGLLYWQIFGSILYWT